MAPEAAPGAARDDRPGQDVVSLFHRLNNQLGVILANSELLESKLTDESQRVRAAQVVTGTMEAIGTVQHLKRAVGLTSADLPKSGS